jgi:hypothetical protein
VRTFFDAYVKGSDRTPPRLYTKEFGEIRERDNGLGVANICLTKHWNAL